MLFYFIETPVCIIRDAVIDFPEGNSSVEKNSQFARRLPFRDNHVGRTQSGPAVTRDQIQDKKALTVPCSL